MKNGFTPKANYDTALRNLRSAEAQLAAAKANLDLTRDQLSYTELKAEFDGVITAVGAEAGQNVTPGQLMVRLARPGDKDAVFSIAETAIGDRAEHGAVLVWPLSNPNLLVEGMVREISPVADPTTRTYTGQGHAEGPAAADALRHEHRRALEGQRRCPSWRCRFRRCSTRTARRPSGWSIRPPARVALKPVTVARYETDTRDHRRRACQGRHRRHRRRQHAAREPEGAPRDAGFNGEQPMSDFNLSDWALEHKSFVVYLMLVTALAGLLALRQARPRGRPALHHQDHGGEDAVARRHHHSRRCSRSPTASRRSSRSCRTSITCSSYTKPGESVVFVNLKDTTRAADVPDLWYQVRKKIGDIRQTLPREVSGAVLQRRVRRHLLARLRAHRRRLHATASCATMPSACAPSCCACPTSPRSTCSACRTRRSTSSSRPSRSPRSASTSSR